MSWQKVKRDKADALFSEYIRKRDKKCLRCNRPGSGKDGILGLQASHFQGRRKENTRFDPLNVDSLCPGCHAYFTQNPAEHYQWQIKRKGQNVIDRLILASNTYKKKDRVLEALYWKQELDKQEMAKH